MKYARIHNNQIVEIVDLDDNVESRMINGDPVLRPLVYSTPPTYNGTIQMIRERYVLEPSTVTVEYDVIPLFTDVTTYKTTVEGLINSWRDVELRKEVFAHGRYWQADRRSRELLSDAITLAGVGVPLPPVWRDATNQNMTVTSIADLVTIASAIAVNTQSVYQRSWDLKQYVVELPDAASSIEALANLTWDTVIS